MEHRETTETLRDYLRVIFKYKLIFLILPIAIVIPVYVSLQMITPKYIATVKMHVKGIQETKADFYRSIATMFSMMSDHSQLLKSNAVLSRVVDALELYNVPLDYEKQFATPLKAAFIEKFLRERVPKALDEEQEKKLHFNAAMARLRGSINTEPILQSTFYNIIVRDYDARQATLIANSLSRSYVIFNIEQQIQDFKVKYGEKHASIKQLRSYIDKMKKTLHGRVINDADLSSPSSVTIIQQALGATFSSGVNKPALIIIAYISGIFFSIIFSFVLEYFNNTVKSQKDIEKHLNIPYLYSLPKRKFTDKQLIGHASPVKKNYHVSLESLAEQLRMSMRNNNLKSLLMASVDGPSDSAVIIANIGIYLSQKVGYRVLLIDANFRSGLLADLCQINNDYGLADILKGVSELEHVIQDLGSNLNIITPGKTDLNESAILDSSEMADMLEKAKEYYEIILVNCAGMIRHSDALILSSYVECMTIIINEGKMRRQVIQKALVPFKQKNVNILGAILNNRKYVIPKIIYKIT